MTRAPGNTAGTQPQRIAALHRRGEDWRLVVIEPGDPVRVVAAVPVAGDLAGSIAESHKAYGFASLVRVAPATDTIARAASVPAAEPAETASALSLLSEAQLPTTLPPHRRAAGLIADGGRNGTRAVLLTGWEGTAQPAGAILRRVPERWTTEVAALAFLRAGHGPWAACSDAATGAVSVLATGPGRTAARVLVEDATSAARFRQSAARIVAETCAAVGAEPPPRETAPVALDHAALAHLHRSVEGLPQERAWLDDYGIALGAALAASSPDPLSRALAEMRETPPVEHASTVGRVVSWLARPRHAWLTAAACILALLLGPLALGALRLAVLEAKSAGLADRTRQRADEQLRAALYAQLQGARWPMTKLLADAAGAAPVGVVADSIMISPEQGLSIHGTAQNPEQVNTFQANLNATRVFSGVRVGRVAASSSGVEFELSAGVSGPHNKATGAEDFAARPLAVRLYGEGASNTASPVSGAPAPEARASRPPRRIEPESEAREQPERSEGARESRRPTPTPSQPTEPPAPLTEEQIKAMDRGTATKEMVARRTFPQRNPTTDAATRERLNDEVRRIQEHLKSLQSGGPP